jgi:protease-4
MAIARIDIIGNINDRMENRIVPILNYVQVKKKYRAIIIYINSPGGSASSSETIARKVQELSKRKPVYAVISGTGASGSYWIAASCDRIYASGTSIVGSVGIISVLPSFKGLMDKLGVKVDIAKVGEFKSLLSPFEERDQQAIDHMNGTLVDLFEGFRNDIIRLRHISDDKVASVINGDVFSSKKGLELGLIDAIGDTDAALSYLKEKFQIGGKVRNLSPRAPFISRYLSGAVSSAINFIFQE